MEQENNYEGKTPEELLEILAKKDEDLKKAESDKTATVGELKDLRTKKQEIEKELEEARKPKDQVPDGGESATQEQQFEAFLQKKQQEDANKNKERALADFRSSHHEFSEASDPGGIKFAAFEREMAKFNLSGLSSVDDFNTRFREVHEFMNRSKKPDESISLHNGTPRNPTEQTPANEGALDADDKKLIEQLGWTQERYLKYKEKNPAYVEQQKSYLS